MRGLGYLFPAFFAALFLGVAFVRVVSAEQSVLVVPWRCGSYLALPEWEGEGEGEGEGSKMMGFGGQGRRLGGVAHRLRGGTIFFSAFRRGPASLQIIVGRRGDAQDNDGGREFIIDNTNGGPAVSPLMMEARRGLDDSAKGLTGMTATSTVTTRPKEEEEEKLGEAQSVARAEVFPLLGFDERDGASSSSASSLLDNVFSFLFSADHHNRMGPSPFFTDPEKLLRARTRFVYDMEDRTMSRLSESEGGDRPQVHERDDIVESASAAAAAAAAAAKAGAKAHDDFAVGTSAENTEDAAGDGQDVLPLFGEAFVGNDFDRSSSRFPFSRVYSWAAANPDGEGGARFYSMRLEAPERASRASSLAGGVVRCVKGWLASLSSCVLRANGWVQQQAFLYADALESCAMIAVFSVVPIALLLSIVHVVARCTYYEEEEEEEEEGEEDGEEGRHLRRPRTVVVVTANSSSGNDSDVRTPLLDNCLYRGEDPSDSDEELSKLEATVVDYNPPNPADVTRGA